MYERREKAREGGPVRRNGFADYGNFGVPDLLADAVPQTQVPEELEAGSRNPRSQRRHARRRRVRMIARVVGVAIGSGLAGTFLSVYAAATPPKADPGPSQQPTIGIDVRIEQINVGGVANPRTTHVPKIPDS